jgi:hypothetical protein
LRSQAFYESAEVLFDDKLLFIHVPKTAGVSITKFLIDNLPGKITLVEEQYRPHPSIPLPVQVRVKLSVKRLLKVWGMLMPASVTIVEGNRHGRLFQAQECLAKLGRRLDDFCAILAVVRNPYDLEVSRYHFLRKGWHGVSGLARGAEQKIAMEGDFEKFALKAPYHGRLPARIEEWYEIDGRMPENLRIVRFEHLEEDLRRVVGEFYPITAKLPRLNASEHESYESYLTPRSEEAIYNKFRWLFDRQFYARETIASLVACK